MAHGKPRIVIDARPRGPRGPWASERILGRPLLAHQLALLRRCGFDQAVVVTSDASTQGDTSESGVDVSWVDAPRLGDAVLRTDRLYDPRRLRRALRTGRDPDTAVVWRLDLAGDLEAAVSEWTRRLSYQPIGHVWAGPLARGLARIVAPTWIRPNHLTITAFGLMLLAAALIATGSASVTVHLATAASLALALVLDTADGHLARLQGTASTFGRWLDAVMDELADVALHAAIGWSLAMRTGQPGWMMLAIGYVAGKYLFTVARIEASIQADATSTGPAVLEGLDPAPSLLRRLVHGLGHADVRWHFWIVLAAVGHLEVALITHALYYPGRVLAIAWKQGARR